ncbi:hypothetical protein PFISCL1PPCAC_9027, partial [Pristionchus fissidentatus]
QSHEETIETETIRFIDAIKERPAIWNRNLRTYKDAQLKDNLFAQIEEELGWTILEETSPESLGKRAKGFWSKLLGNLRRVQKQPSEIGPHTITEACVSALDFYIEMLDDVSAKREANRIAAASAPGVSEQQQHALDTVASAAQSAALASLINSVAENSGVVPQSLGFILGEDPSAFLQRVVKMYPGEEPEEMVSIIKEEEPLGLVEEPLEQKASSSSSSSDLPPEVTSSSDNNKMHAHHLNIGQLMDAAMCYEGEHDDGDEADVLRFIGAIEAREGLWKRSSSLYRMPAMKLTWFAEVELECQMAPAAGHNARQRWQRLIASYRTYVSEIVQGRSTGFISPSTRAFKYYEAMQFYEESYKASIAVNCRRRETLTAKRLINMADGCGFGAFAAAAQAQQMQQAAVAAAAAAANEQKHQQSQQQQQKDKGVINQVLESIVAMSHLPTTSFGVTGTTTSISNGSSPQRNGTGAFCSPDLKKRRKESSSSSFPLGGGSPSGLGSSPSSINSVSAATERNGAAAAKLMTTQLQVAPNHSELYALIDHVMEGLGLIQATQAKGEIISFLVQLKQKYE